MTGLSDFSGWKPEWCETIFVRMAQNPQQDYLFLIMWAAHISAATDIPAS